MIFLWYCFCRFVFAFCWYFWLCIPTDQTSFSFLPFSTVSNQSRHDVNDQFFSCPSVSEINVVQSIKQFSISAGFHCLRRGSRTWLGVGLKVGWKWKWSNGVRKGEIYHFNVYLSQTMWNHERAQTANLIVFTIGGHWLTGALC